MKRLALLSLIVFFGVSVEAIAKDIKVKSWCPITHAVGIGHGSTFESAKSAAIQACLANGGLAKCCYKYYRQI